MPELIAKLGEVEPLVTRHLQCEHPGCGKDGEFGFARQRQRSHWFCVAHRGDGVRFL